MYTANEEARAASGKIFVSTDRLVYNPGDKVTFDIVVQPDGEAMQGDLLIKVHAAASPLDENAFKTEPLFETLVKPGLDVSGESRMITYEAGTTGDLRAGNGGFPVKVSLVKDGREEASGESWLAVVDPGTRDAIDVVLVWTVGNPPQRDPQGVFQDKRLLDRCQGNSAPDNIGQHLDLSGKFPRINTTYAVEGLLLDELSDMTDGFTLNDGGTTRQLEANSREAATALSCLEGLKSLVKTDNTEMLSTPYVFANLPILAKNGWNDGNGQYRIGHDVLTETLDLSAAPRGAYIPNLDLTTDSLRYVAATGGEYAVLGGFIRQNVTGPVKPETVAFRLRDLSGERITSLFSQDDASDALAGNAANPNAFFAALANTYESGSQPGIVIAASPVANPPVSAETREQIYKTLDAQTWINSLTLKEAEVKYHPDTHPATLQRYIEPLAGYVQETYFEKLSQVHQLFEAYRLAVDSDEPELRRLVKNMYTAESEYFLSKNANLDQTNIGLAYQNEAVQLVRNELAGLKLYVGSPLLQRAASGEATITINNEQLYAFNVDLVLAGDGMEFPDGDRQRLRLSPGLTEIKVPYRSNGWSRLTASLQSGDMPLVTGSSGIHPVTTRVWIVLLALAAAIIAAATYYAFIIRKR